MDMFVVKTGVEQYANRIYTSTFFIMPAKRGDVTTVLTDHGSYIPHEEIICGINACFGRWEIGHIALPHGARILGVFTRKIMAYDPHDMKTKHIMLHCLFSASGDKKRRRYTLNYWGYNGGVEISEMLVGKFSLIEEAREKYKLGTPLSKLPF